MIKCKSGKFDTLKSFLIFLNMIREDELTDIESDNYVLKTLRIL